MSRTPSPRGPRVRNFWLALGSAGALILAFPGFTMPECAWVALVPWLLLLRGVSLRAAWWWSALIGFLFFLGSIVWLTHVTVIGWALLCAFLALYFGLFGVIGRLVFARAPRAAAPALLGAAWVLLEYLRNWVFSGFGWNLLAYSQTPWVPMLQIADLTGAWGVSFLIVWVNAWLALLIQGPPRALTPSRFRPRVRGQEISRREVAALASLPLAAWLYGVVIVGSFAAEGAVPVRIAVVQGNIPQEEKWDEAHQGSILSRYERLSQGIAAQRPDLIVWPETSVPGYFWADEELTQRVMGIARAVQTPLLVGAPMLRVRPGSMLMTNSASLVSPDGEPLGRYDKIHLVPYGEFIPFEREWPWLRQALPPIGDFVSGEESTVFRIDASGRPLPFSVLICFEDLFPELARAFVRRGAKALIVITNDAWFGPSAAAHQHAQASTLRAVEGRVPVARAANTGWSGCIDAAGRWTASVRDASGAELFVEGATVCGAAPGPGRSLYVRFGDWFVALCALGLAGWGIINSLAGRPRGASRGRE